MPKSLTQEYFTTSITPVSGSTSTSATWQPLGKVDAPGPSLTCVTSSDCGASAGSLTPSRSFCASSMMPIARSVPAMTKRPSRELDVGGGGLEHVRGDLLALLDHLGGGLDDRGAAVHDRFRAAAAAAGDEPIAVALHQRIFSNGMPSFSLSTCANGVAWPMPKSSVPVMSVTVPSALKRDVAHFLRRRRGDFEKVADAEPAQLAALAALALALRQSPCRRRAPAPAWSRAAKSPLS